MISRLTLVLRMMQAVYIRADSVRDGLRWLSPCRPIEHADFQVALAAAAASASADAVAPAVAVPGPADEAFDASNLYDAEPLQRWSPAALYPLVMCASGDPAIFGFPNSIFHDYCAHFGRD